jgi:uncharacterized protein
MKAKVLNETGERTTALIFDAGDEVMTELRRFVQDHQVTAARFTAVGALSRATLGFFDLERQDYAPIEVPEQVEVLSMMGDVSLKDGNPDVHAHIVLGKRDGSTVGGHLLEASVLPTLELMLIESPTHLARTFRPEFGLPLIDLDR